MVSAFVTCPIDVCKTRIVSRDRDQAVEESDVVMVTGIYDDDDVYLTNYYMTVGYKIYLHTNTDQQERHKYKMIYLYVDMFIHASRWLCV
jgi:uridine kinase